MSYFYSVISIYIAFITTILLFALDGAFASHTVTATPSGAIFNSSQLVTLSSSDSSAFIYYTIDGNDPSTSSPNYNGTAILVSANVTLKFIAANVAENHTSAIAAEDYVIDMSPPTVNALPAGGIYDSSQNITLEASEPLSSIYYTTDGNDPTSASANYNDVEILISANTTLKFFAIDQADNPSVIYTENYEILLPPPVVVDTQPDNSGRRIDVFSIVNATFNLPMNGSNINSNTFTVLSQFGSQVFGTVEYDPITNTASFIPDPFSPLSFGTEYTATLTEDIKDIAGTPIERTEWNFTTGGQIMIFLQDVQTFSLVNGSTFTITPNPFSLQGSLDVTDNDINDSDYTLFGSATDGIILVNNVENDFTTYLISETELPDSYSNLYGDLIVTVVELDACFDGGCSPTSLVVVENILSTSSVADTGMPVGVPPPYLNRSQFELYEDDVIIGKFSGIANSSALPTLGPILDPHSTSLPSASIVTSETFDEVDPDSFVFPFTSPAGSTGREIFENFEIPKYPGLSDDVIAGDVMYLLPPIVIPYEDSKDNFILTPIIDSVSPGLTITMHQLSFVENKIARFERMNMTFAVEGDDVGFSFGVTDTPPPDTPQPPLDATALFLDVGFVGNVDFSDPQSFESPPRIDILVNKTLSGFDELPDGCIDFVMLLFDEDDEEWLEVQKLRNPTLDSGAETPDDPTDDKCGFTLEPPHFSKFAVGGIKGTAFVTESIAASAGGGGGSRPASSGTSIQQMTSGENVVVATGVGTESILSRFEFVEPGSGQLKIESGPVTMFEELFDEITDVQRDNDKQGIVQLNDMIYTTIGIVFDIDSSDVKHRGPYDITIPYEEELISLSSGSESDVRLLHYNDGLKLWEDVTVSQDQVANTVTGRLNSSSPVVGVLLSGDNVGRKISVSNIELAGTPDSDSSQWQIARGEPLILAATIETTQAISANDQSLVFIVQTLNEEGVAVDINFQTITLGEATSTKLTHSLVEDDPGMYRIELLIWTSLDLPEPLANATLSPMIKVTE